MNKTAQNSSKTLSRLVRKRRGIHAKSKSSKMKKSRLYVKKYKGQGKT